MASITLPKEIHSEAKREKKRLVENVKKILSCDCLLCERWWFSTVAQGVVVGGHSVEVGGWGEIFIEPQLLLQQVAETVATPSTTASTVL